MVLRDARSEDLPAHPDESGSLVARGADRLPLVAEVCIWMHDAGTLRHIWHAKVLEYWRASPIYVPWLTVGSALCGTGNREPTAWNGRATLEEAMGACERTTPVPLRGAPQRICWHCYELSQLTWVEFKQHTDQLRALLAGCDALVCVSEVLEEDPVF